MLPGIFRVVKVFAFWLVSKHDHLFLCTRLNLQEDSFTDGSGQKDRLNSTSTESSSSSGSDKPLLSPSGMSSLSADLSHYSGAVLSVYVSICSCYPTIDLVSAGYTIRPGSQYDGCASVVSQASG